jgi:tetratricopeptide (TPR) repeat protein
VARGNVEGNTVSVASLLTPPKAERAYEHVEKDFARNKLEDAEKELNTALAIYPKSAVAWCLMGTLREKKLQVDEASVDYSRALLIDSHLLPAYLGLARIAFRGKRWQEVIQFTDRLVSVDSLGFPVATSITPQLISIWKILPLPRKARGSFRPSILNMNALRSTSS